MDHLECLDHEDTYASNLFNLTQAKFVNPQVSDFHIQESSLAKDAGVALTTDHSIAQDFDGVIRVYRKDLGAYEYVEPTTTTTPPTTGVPNTAMSDCETAVESVCVIDENYGKMISCVSKAIKREQGCESAIALNEDKGIGHIMSDETMYWRTNQPHQQKRVREHARVRRREQEIATYTCGEAAFSQCGDSCDATGSAEEAEWFSCLGAYIYGDAIAHCQQELTDESAWDYIAITCGYYE